MAIYICHVNLGLSLTTTASVYGRDRTTAAHACRKIEDLRDSQGVDRLVDSIERASQRFRSALGHEEASP